MPLPAVSRCSETAALFDHLVGAGASNSAFSLALSCSSAARLTLGRKLLRGPSVSKFLSCNLIQAQNNFLESFFFEIVRGQLPPAGVPIVGGTNEQKITRG